MRKAFEAEGYPRTWLSALDLKPANGSSIVAAERAIAPAVVQLLGAAQSNAKETGCVIPTKVDIVAHSMGSMAARWYVARLDATRVRNLVGIAPANHGSDAVCGLAGEGNRELCPAFARDEQASPFQVQINGTEAAALDETPFGVGIDSPRVKSIDPDHTRRINYTTFRLADDEWLQPDTSPVLDGAGGLQLHELGESGVATTPGNFLWRRSVRHDDLPKDPLLIRAVMVSLQRDSAQ